MTYVRQQTSEELAAHMRYLQGLPGWHDPLADRLWQEVEALRAEIAGLKTGYEAYEQINAGLKAENEALRKDSDRYQWLRDKSEAVHQFYLSVPLWFTGVRFRAQDVDNAIDAMSKGGDKQ